MPILQLYSNDTDEFFEIEVSEEDAIRAYNDTPFATQLLEVARTQGVQSLQPDCVQEQVDVQPVPSICSEEQAQIERPEDTGSCLKWSTAAVRLLLETYRNMEGKFETQSHKKTWEDIVQEMLKNGHKFTGPQAAAKLRSLKKSYKSVKDHNSKSGNDRRSWPYFEIMDEIFQAKAWVAPVAVASSSGLSTKQTDANVQQTMSKTEPKTSVVALLKKRLRQKEEHEEAKQKRHKERMEMDAKMLDVLQQLVNK